MAKGLVDPHGSRQLQLYLIILALLLPTYLSHLLCVFHILIDPYLNEVKVHVVEIANMTRRISKAFRKLKWWDCHQVRVV